MKMVRRSTWRLTTPFLAITASFLLFSLIAYNSSVSEIQANRFLSGISHCEQNRMSVEQPIQSTVRSSNPRNLIGPNHKSTLFTNVTLLDGDGTIRYNTSILLQNGVITKIGATDRSAELEINANGRFVTPGIIDMHSHAGLSSWPNTNGGSDVNEVSGSPLRPELNAIDGFDPNGEELRIINSGGITTTLILPGSANMMGGEAIAVKLRKMESNRVEDMLLNTRLNASEGKVWRYMKMACGENAIGTYGTAGIMPQSRLGEGYLFRKRFETAALVKREQDDWCSDAQYNRNIKKEYPNPIDQNSLIALLRGQVKLNVHCYEGYDIEMMIRLSKEYKFKITAFHHALEAFTVADLLAKENIGTALFSDHFGYKQEAYGASVNGAKTLVKAGVKVAFKSDHPVTNAQNLIYDAAKAYHYGLSPEQAIQSVTSIPAVLMGQDHRIGYLRAGYDADLVIWDKNPLEIGAHPLKVVIDGHVTFEHADYLEEMAQHFEAVPMKEPPAQGPTLNVSEANLVTYFNISGLIHSQTAKAGLSKLVVENDIVVCIGLECASRGVEKDLKGGWVIPGLIAVQSHLGIEDIASERATSAGRQEGDTPLSTADGLKVEQRHSKMLQAAFKAGFTTAVSSLRFLGPLGAISTAFRIGSPKMSEDVFITEEVATNFALGDYFKQDGISNSIPGQLKVVRKHLNQDLKIAIETDSASIMYSVIKAVKGRDNVIIVGGAEAHMVANELAAGNISVVLRSARCTPNTWYTQDCLVASSSPSAYQLLRDKKVLVSIAAKEDNFVRGLLWEAAWLVADTKEYKQLTDFERAKEAVALLTWNAAKMYSLDEKVGSIALGRRATFVVYTGVPGTLAAKVRMVVDGHLKTVDTEQY